MKTFALDTAGEQRNASDPRIAAIIHMCKARSVVKYAGDVFVYIESLEEWSNVVTPESQLVIAGIVGTRNATVNYTMAVSPYVRLLERNGICVPWIPPSVCMGRQRLAVSIAGGRVTFTLALLLDGASDGTYKQCFCVLPVDTRVMPSVWEYDDKCSVSLYLAPLFEQHEEYISIMWHVGNSMVDPRRPSHLVILHGGGGNGKTTLTAAMRSIMGGCCKPIELTGIMAGLSSRMPKLLIQTLASARIAVCGEVEFGRGTISPSYIKIATGGDPMALPPFSVTINATVIAGCNSLPRLSQNAMLLGDAMQRRVRVVPMTVNALALPEAELTRDPQHHMDWLCRCIYHRLTLSHPPMSTRSLIASLCHDAAGDVYAAVMIRQGASVVSCITATALIALKLELTMERIGAMLSFYGPECYHSVAGLKVVRNVAPIHDGNA